MSSELRDNDLIDKAKTAVYRQSYQPQSFLEGVKLVNLVNHVGEDGDFTEVIRLNNNEVEGFDKFNISQINRSRLLPNTIKAWHLHFRQDEIWYVVPTHQLLVGLWDVRSKSPSADKTMRITLGGGLSQLLFIPRGVAHGMANLSPKNVDLFYFINRQFDSQNPDENRLAWNILGQDFWQPQKD